MSARYFCSLCSARCTCFPTLKQYSRWLHSSASRYSYFSEGCVSGEYPHTVRATRSSVCLSSPWAAIRFSGSTFSSSSGTPGYRRGKLDPVPGCKKPGGRKQGQSLFSGPHVPFFSAGAKTDPGSVSLDHGVKGHCHGAPERQRNLDLFIDISLR